MGDTKTNYLHPRVDATSPSYPSRRIALVSQERAMHKIYNMRYDIQSCSDNASHLLCASNSSHYEFRTFDIAFKTGNHRQLGEKSRVKPSTFFAVILVLFCQNMLVSYAANNQPQTLQEAALLIHGGDPLHPTAESLVGKYLAETQAISVIRAFPKSADATESELGPARLFIAVDEKSFPVFKKYFSEKYLLSHFHEPHQQIMVAAFKDQRGSYARLEDAYRFTYSGVMVMPLILLPSESERAENYFKLAQMTSRRFDVALYPWLLTNGHAETYTAVGNAKSLTDWFLNMPLGDAQDEKRVEYDRETVSANALAKRAPALSAEYFSLLEQVWKAPYAHASLARVLEIDQLNLKNPGRVAAALLGSASIERLPIVFRFVNDRKVDPKPDFDPWFSIGE